MVRATTEGKQHGTAEVSAAPYEFELSGGRPCLDFANSISHRATEPVEHLNKYEDLLSWAVQAGAIGEEEAAELRRRARGSPAAAEETLARAIELRETIYRTFLAVAEGRRPAERDLQALNAALAEALAHARLEPDREEAPCCRWSWDDAEPSLDRPLWPVVRSAAELLTSDDLSRVRVCDAETCQWLFLDMSRNRSRRWCDMKVCGNREKARRHYRKVKVGG